LIALKHVEIVKDCTIKGFKFKKGGDVEIDDLIADRLIARGYVKPFVKKEIKKDAD
jgi:ribosomal protein L31E